MAKKATPIHEELTETNELTEAEELKLKEAERQAEADRVANENAEELARLEAEEQENEEKKKKEAEAKAKAEAEAKKNPAKAKTIKNQTPPAPLFPLDKYYMEVEDEVNVSTDPEYPRYEVVKKLKLRREFANVRHRIKCRIRAARHYNVTIDHLQSAYKQLNGKKIDGIFINFLIDRFGFSTGEQMNRIDTAKLCGLPVGAVEVADEKLKVIIQKAHVLPEYKEYLKTFTDENTHETFRDSYNV